MTELDLTTIHDRVAAYARLMVTIHEYRDQEEYDAAAHSVARLAPKLLVEVERLQAEDRAWAGTILAQRDAAIATVARVRALLDHTVDLVVPSEYLVPMRPDVPFPAVWADNLREALDGGDAT